MAISRSHKSNKIERAMAHMRLLPYLQSACFVASQRRGLPGMIQSVSVGPSAVPFSRVQLGG